MGFIGQRSPRSSCVLRRGSTIHEEILASWALVYWGRVSCGRTIDGLGTGTGIWFLEAVREWSISHACRAET